jgi:biopolymer transport protein ExbD
MKERKGVGAGKKYIMPMNDVSFVIAILFVIIAVLLADKFQIVSLYNY